MKTIILLLFAALFSLSNCTEEIIIDKIFRDTVYIDKPQSFAPTFVTVTDTIEIHTIDTVEVRIVIHETDTLIQYVTKDSIIVQEVEKIIYHTDTVKVTIVQHDTIVNEIEVVRIDTVIRNVIQHDTVTVTVYDRTVVYLDTLHMPLYWKSLNFVPQELEIYVREFYGRGLADGWNLRGGPLVIQYVHDLAGEGWNSFSYWIGEEQMVIEVNGALDPKFLYTCVLRELGRLQLKKKYVTSGDLIMNIYFDPERLTIDSPDKESYLSDLFSNPI